MRRKRRAARRRPRVGGLQLTNRTLARPGHELHRTRTARGCRRSRITPRSAIMEAMSQNDLKKQRERSALEALRNADPKFPTGLIEETEEPDFVITDDDSRLGIEVTEYF